MQVLLSVAQTLPTFEVFARGGGGGSGGGSGGGGGGIALIGYLPAHFTSDWCTRHYGRRLGILAGSVAGFAISVIFTLFLLRIAPFDLVVIVIGAAVGVWTGSLNILGKLRVGAAKNQAAIAAAASKDPAWSEASLKAHITTVFNDYQRDWSTFNLEHIKTYTTPQYFAHNSLMLAALKTMGRQNVVGNPQLLNYYVADINDDEDDAKDAFTAVIVGKASDKLIDVQDNNKVLYTDPSQFIEYWHFARSGSQWLLSGIEQATADIAALHLPLMMFAAQNSMFYSLDWGWLLLPKRGQLFRGSSFMKSDINNHVIGQWNGIIVQLYTYKPDKQVDTNYQIAQITLPKSYGGIVIERKKWYNRTPRGYMRLSYEWPDFNNRYAVFATDMDKVTSFELLNPKFMADLYDKDLKVEIEVVDNVVYLYSKLSTKETKYPEMLEILRQVFHELKM